MIFDVLDRIDFDLQKAVFDNYVLKDGLYVRINDNRVEYFLFKDSKKEDKKQLLFKDLDGNIRANEYEWFVSRDYLSGYLNSNKAIDPPKKKIHSNNYLALFVKASEFTSENKEHFAEKLFDNLKKFKSFTKKQEKEVLEGYKDYIFDEERQKDVEKKKELFLGYFDEIVSVIEENEIKNYIKIFFDEPLEKYEKESEMYYVLKIYNKIDTIREIKGKIYGLSDFNMGLNQKKPYLEHKTRGFSLPFMVEKDKIFEVKKLFDYLKNLKEPLKYEPTATAPGIYLHKHNENDQAVIDDFDILVFVEENLPKKFEYKNYIGLTSDGRALENREITTFEGIYKLIDEVFYNGNLSNNLYGDVYSKLPHDFQNLIYLTRDLAKNILKRDIDSLFGYLRFGMDFIIYNIRQNRLFKAGEILNLILSIKAYKGENVDIKGTLAKIEEKVKNLEELNSNEWHILSGQVVKYLLDKSKKSDKKADMIEPFLRAGKTKKLKDEIEALYFKY
ncbi:hypothetical protein, partial [Caminibacter pacificus]